MHGWTSFLIALGIVLVLAPTFALAGKRHGRSVRGAAGLAMILLGLGQVLDPPKSHLIEAMEGEENADETSGETKDSASGS